MSGLQIYAPRERALVGAADVLLRPLGWFRGDRTAPARPVSRVLLLRLERIGDLLMTLEAIALAQRAWPGATIDLAVGSWNLPLAKLIPGIGTVRTVDVPWLARDGRGDSWSALVGHARAWKQSGYDVVVNFEPDIRTNALAWLSGAPQRHGYWTGGGGAFLTHALSFEPASHVGANATRLIREAAGPAASSLESDSAAVRLSVPADATTRARDRLASLGRPIIGVHVSGGRESKQWHLDRFATVARQLAETRRAAIVLTGSEADRPMVAAVEAKLGGLRVLNAAGAVDLIDLAGLLSELDVLITSDTGPMHLAAAVGTPLVALFGPSDPRRYGPVGSEAHILRVDLPCSPCGQVRLPPERCRGHVPDCMDGIQVAAVVSAATALLDKSPRAAQTGARALEMT
jgi:ADP-heptose:LPS heptosyltransferase